METVITRDTDILREYLASLDARERGVSPFAKFAATVKLARLRREIDGARIETTDEDIIALRREIDDRLDRSFLRRLVAKPWSRRVAAFLMLVLGQQIVLAMMLLAHILFVKLMPVPAWWNPVLPRDEPVFLYVFIFLFFFLTPVLALALVFGGRYFRAWPKTLPLTFLILALSALGVFLVARGKVNPVRRVASLVEFAKERGLNETSYRQWIEANWLMKDAKFQRDYESYLRNGPGRWITSRFNSKDDAEWEGSLTVLNEYLNTGQDPDGFNEWLKYYLDRNRIYSEDRIDQEVAAITGIANRDYLGIWQVEPYLKERDERAYRAYLGSINKAMKFWGVIWLALLALCFLAVCSIGPALSFLERKQTGGTAGNPTSLDPENVESERVANTGLIGRLKERWDSFPERSDINTSPFFDTPFKLLSRTHRSYLRLALLASVFVFAFWAAVYATDLSAGKENAPSYTAFMRSHLLFGGSADEGVDERTALLAESSGASGFNYTALADALPPADSQSDEAIITARVRQIEMLLDEAGYQNSKEFEKQSRMLTSQRNDLNFLRGLSSELRDATSQVPDLFSEVNSRIGAAEARAGQVSNDLSATRQQAEDIKSQLSTKIQDVETRVARAADQVGKIEDKTSGLATRTEALEKEVDARAGQIEARTIALGERTASLKDSEDRLNRLQNIAFAAILSNMRADVERLANNLSNRDEARREAASLRQRIGALMTSLRDMDTDQARQLIGQLDTLNKRVEAIANQIK